MEKAFESTCREKGGRDDPPDTELNPLQNSMQTAVTAVNHISAIVVCPHDQGRDRASHWRGVAEAAMEVFGVEQHITRTYNSGYSTLK